uniref:Beta-keratin n=1 Tax=Gekko gecko TaxID=36310 RepID=B7T4S5_GEKGE|nr:beta-keratin [Gekko gecko]
MSGYGYNQCYASCPASTVTIQPPPFVLTIPGPALYCPNQPLAIEQYNPCAHGGGYPMSSSGAGGSLGSSFYSQALPSSSFSSSSYRY